MNRSSLQGMKISVGTMTRIAAVLALVCTHAFSQFEVDGRPVVLSHSARAEGLANSYVSETREVGAMYFNPASLSHLVLPQAALGMYHVWDGNQATGYLAVPAQVFNFWTVAVGLTTTAIGDDYSDPIFVHRSVDVGSAIRISPSVSLGFMVQIQQSLISSDRVWTTTGSVGLLYTPTSGFRYGMALEGLGSSVDYSRYQLNPIHPTKILRMGTSYSFPLLKSRKLITMTVTGEKHFGLPNLHYSLAIEVSPFPFFDFRIGYIKKPDNAIDFGSGARYGVSFNTDFLSFDYCISPSLSAQKHHQGTILVVIP